MILSIFVFNFVKRCSKSGGIVIGRRAAEAVSRGSSILQIFFSTSLLSKSLLRENPLRKQRVFFVYTQYSRNTAFTRPTISASVPSMGS